MRLANECDTRCVESLLLVVAELVSVPRFVALALLVALGTAAALVLGHLTIGRRLRSWPLRWWRRLAWATIGGLGFMLAGLVFIDLLLFGPALRISLDQIELRSGLDIGFTRASGSLLAGRLELEDVTIRRSGPGLDLSLTVRELAIDVDMVLLHRRALPVSRVRAVGVRGAIVRREGIVPRSSRPFVIAQLELEDVQVDFEDAITAPIRNLPIVFESLRVAPLRSELAMLDVLCSSEARGSARGYGFGAAGHAWQARGIPIGPAAHKLGAVARWIRSGDLDLVLRCGDDSEADPVPVTVDLRLHDFKIAPPGDSGRHLPASRIAEAFTGLGPDISLHLELSLPHERFRGASSIAQLGLWEGAILAWNMALGRRLDLSPEDMRVLGVPAQPAMPAPAATPGPRAN